MSTHLLRSKILDTAKLAQEAEDFAASIPNYWEQNKTKNATKNATQNAQGNPKEGQQQNFGGYKNGKRKFPFKNGENNDGGNTGTQSSDNPSQSQNKPFYKNGGTPNKQNKPNSHNTQHQGRPNPQVNQQGNKSQFPSANDNSNTGNTGQYNTYICEQVQDKSGQNKHGRHGKPKQSADERFIISGQLEQTPVQIFRDSGCNKTAVNSKLVPDSCLTGKNISVKGIHGYIQLPTAYVHIQSTRFTGQVEVVVVEDLDYDVLLGREVDSWDDSPKMKTTNPRIKSNNYRPGNKTYQNRSFRKQRPQIQYNVCYNFLYEGYCTRPHCRFIHSFPNFFWPHQELRALGRNNQNWRQNGSNSFNWRNNYNPT
jgi:hypothetical protein